MLVGGALAVWFVQRSDLSWALMLVGFAAAWAAGEWLIGKRLIGASDTKAIALAVVSGLAFPWVGVAFTALVQALRP
jgi:hypothetical protein